MEGGFYKEDIINRFSELGYNVCYKLMRASDYGVPQSRERVFFVGLHKDIFGDAFLILNELKKENCIDIRSFE